MARFTVKAVNIRPSNYIEENKTKSKEHTLDALELHV
jgi:hypothetical protein